MRTRFFIIFLSCVVNDYSDCVLYGSARSSYVVEVSFIIFYR